MRGFQIKTNIFYNDKRFDALNKISHGKILIFMENRHLKEYNEKIYPVLRDRTVKIIYISEKDYRHDPDRIEEHVLETIRYQPDCIITFGNFLLFNYTKLIRYYVLNTYSYIDAPDDPGISIHIPVHLAGGFAVSETAYLMIRERGLLQWVDDRDLSPDALILNPILGSPEDKQEMEFMAITAICTAIDSYISTASDEFSSLFAEKGLKIINRSLLMLGDSDLPFVLNKIQVGSVMSGLALNQSSIGLGWLFSLFLHKHFGKNINEYFPIIMPEIINYNLKNDIIKSYFAKLGRKINFHYPEDELNARAFVENLKSMRKTLGMPEKLCHLGIDYPSFIAVMDNLADDIYDNQQLAFNPISLTKEDIREMLLTIA